MNINDANKYHKFVIQLRNARLDSSYTQSDVSTLLGKPQSYVSKCESGERRVDLIELVKFAKIYKKDIYYFIEKKDQDG